MRAMNFPSIWQTESQIAAAIRIGTRSEIVIGCSPPVHCHQIADGTEAWISQNSQRGIAWASPVVSATGMHEDASIANT